MKCYTKKDCCFFISGVGCVPHCSIWEHYPERCRNWKSRNKYVKERQRAWNGKSK